MHYIQIERLYYISRFISKYPEKLQQSQKRCHEIHVASFNKLYDISYISYLSYLLYLILNYSRR